MSRFKRIDGQPVYSDVKSERGEHLGGRERTELRRIYMEETPTPEEIAAARPRQTRGKK